MAFFGPALVSIVVFVLSLIPHVHPYAITGISGGVEASGQRPFRTEINDFAQSGAPFDLYILALQKIQRANESDVASHFQIGGMLKYQISRHGRPS